MGLPARRRGRQARRCPPGPRDRWAQHGGVPAPDPLTPSYRCLGTDGLRSTKRRRASHRLNSTTVPTEVVRRSFRQADRPTERAWTAPSPTPGRRTVPGQPCNSLCNNPGGVVARSCCGALATSVHPLLHTLRDRLVHAATSFLYTRAAEVGLRPIDVATLRASFGFDVASSRCNQRRRESWRRVRGAGVDLRAVLRWT